MQTTGNSRGIKVYNRLIVREIIRKQGPIPRREVAKISCLTPPAVTCIVNDFIRMGIVRETGHGESSGGRRPVMLELNPRAGYILAVQIQRGECIVALLDLGGNTLGKIQKRVETSSLEEVVNIIGKSFDAITRSLGISQQDVLWSGVASPGLIDTSRGIVERSSNLKWQKAPLADLLTLRLSKIPVHVENISNAAALAEKEYVSGRRCSNLLYINLSVGIGAGIIINGEIYRGTQGYAGEVGHMVLSPDEGPICTCGARGCFEALCGVQRVLERLKEKIPEDIFNSKGINKEELTIEDLIKYSLLDMPIVKDIITRTGEIVGMAVSNLVNTFNPDMIILGGELSKIGDLLLEPVRKLVLGRIPYQLSENLQIVISNMSDDPPLMGAYALALGKLFSIDNWEKAKLVSARFS